MKIDRRSLVLAATTAAIPWARVSAASTALEEIGSAFQVPSWFRDAKFGIWSHWGPQCVPEFGDWYGRLMYAEGSPAYEHHLRTYGHPSETGFLDIIGRWKAEAWQPEDLMRRFLSAGARYFVSMANHHDNFDNFDSAHHEWNSVRVGPRRDIVGTWARHARAAGLRFGVSNHSSHAWHWWQRAYGYDTQGPRRGRRYDAYWRRRSHGRGSWWQGLDPQTLYTGPSFVPPKGIDSIAAMTAWHDARDGQWLEDLEERNRLFAEKWLLRQMDLVDRYRPDLVYFDDHGLPFGDIGVAAVAHYYRASRRIGGKLDVVLTAKRLSDQLRSSIVEDVERGFVADIQPTPWQTDTCIGNWHYDRGLFERHGYKTAKQIVQRLCDVVSKNGNLLLSIPQRGDGSIDSDEAAILDGLARWFAINGPAIYGTRPWRKFGEGPTNPPIGMQREAEAKPWTEEDIRFTVSGNILNAFFLDRPTREAAIRSLGRRFVGGAEIDSVALADGSRISFSHDEDALRLRLPAPPRHILSRRSN